MKDRACVRKGLRSEEGKSYADDLVWMIHHCNQKIEKNGYVDDAVTAKHGHSPETGVTLNT